MSSQAQGSRKKIRIDLLGSKESILVVSSVCCQVLGYYLSLDLFSICLDLFINCLTFEWMLLAPVHRMCMG
jgi:hypothetical protein